jgi:hypothetical protein
MARKKKPTKKGEKALTARSAGSLPPSGLSEFCSFRDFLNKQRVA